MYCIFCNKICKNVNGAKIHALYCEHNPNRKDIWNKGLTNETSNSVLTGSKKRLGGEILSIRGVNNPNYGKKFGSNLNGHSDATKQRLSELAKNRKLGGYIQGSGRGKKGWYKGIFCDSSWELAYVIYCLDHNIDIIRNTEKRPYTWDNRIKNYIPDFIVEGKLIEIKGRKTDEWFEKLKANPDVTVLYEKDLVDIFKYIKDKYGNKFIKLYEITGE